MAISKSNIKKNKYKLPRKFQKNGFSCWRYYFYAKSVETGKEVPFFLELLVVNPGFMSSQVMLSQKSRPKISDEDLQSALAGNLVSDNKFEENIIPSFVAIRGGIFGDDRKQFNNFYSSDQIKNENNRLNLQVGANTFSDNSLSGSIVCSKDDSLKFPEYNSNIGKIQWNINYERKLDFNVNSTDSLNWLTTGMICSYSGKIILDSEEFTVSPKFCFGFCDKLWGSSLHAPFFHLASNKLTSIFSGEILENSGFVIQGIDNKKLSFLCKINDEEFIFPIKKNNYTIISNCIPVPGEEESEKIHWTTSLNSKLYVCDVDIFCSAKEMIVRDYEVPSGNNKVHKILSGFTGRGELKIYKKIKKNLDLIHQAKIENCICEFGNIE